MFLFKNHVIPKMKKISLFILLLLSVALFSWIQEPVPKATLERGKKVYETYCLACHQADGAGVPRLNPPLSKVDYVTGDKKRLIGIILNGFSEEVEINGEYYNNVMAPHDFLKDGEIADVLTYIRNSFGNKASAVTEAEVKKERAALKK
jgi:mono/diheme cytochrome c family protein